MTHTTTFPLSNELENAFAQARNGGNRWLKVLIKDEQLVLDGTHPLSSDIQQDLNAVQKVLEPKKPCYVLFRLDSQGMSGYEWILLSYIPEGSPVKERMLYASTRDPLKKQLGPNYFTNTLHGNEPVDFTWESYQAHLNKHSGPAPLTASEIQLHNESSMEVYAGGATEYVHSVRFPLSKDAQNALESFSLGQNMVVLKVDPTKETIELVSAGSGEIEEIAKNYNTSEPRYTFFKWAHQHESDSYESNLFVYTCPENAPVKLKMLYSTVKSVVSQAAESAGIFLERSTRLEVNEVEDLAVDKIIEQLHPKAEKKQRISRPLRPGRGKPRLTRGGK